jgi:ATP-dependent DNA helicase RecQ
MTRAKGTLTVAHMNGRHALLDALPGSGAVLRRPAIQLASPPFELNRQYKRLNLGQVDLGFAGRQEGHKAIHRAIAALTAADPLELKQEGSKWGLVDKTGITIGRLASSYKPPHAMKCISACVAAIVVREREDTKPEFLDSVRCDRWEVVVPELVFAPG